MAAQTEELHAKISALAGSQALLLDALRRRGSIDEEDIDLPHGEPPRPRRRRRRRLEGRHLRWPHPRPQRRQVWRERRRATVAVTG